MTQLNELKIMNDTMILYLKKLGANYERNNIINKILNDETCFFKMSKEDAVLILNDIGIQDNIENIYSKLISSDLFYELYKKGKINLDNNEFVIAYPIYDVENIFKNKKTENKTQITKNEIAVIPSKSFIQKIFDKIKHLFKKN